MELEVINKLYLELSQVATAQTAKELLFIDALTEANERLRSAYSIAKRDGNGTNWESFRNQVSVTLDRQHKILFPLAARMALAALNDTPESK